MDELVKALQDALISKDHFEDQYQQLQQRHVEEIDEASTNVANARTRLENARKRLDEALKKQGKRPIK